MKLRAKLFILLNTLLMVIGLGIFVQAKQSNKILQKASSELKLVAKNNFAKNIDLLKSGISHSFYQYYHQVQSIALNKVLHKKDRSSIEFYFNEIVSLYPNYKLVLFVDGKGDFIAANSINGMNGRKHNKKAFEQLKQNNFKQEKWFKDAKANKLTEDLENKLFGAYVGNIHENEFITGLYKKREINNKTRLLFMETSLLFPF